jgi:hypothetical protein
LWLALLVIVGLGAASSAQAQGRLFGITGAGSTGGGTDDEDRGGGGGGPPSFLFELSPVTGAVIDSIGLTGFRHVTGLSFHPITRRLYGMTSSDSVSQGRLIDIDTQTGVGTEVGTPYTASAGFPDMSFSGAGKLFAWSENGDDLVTVDLVTAQPSIVGNDTNGTSNTGLAFSPADSLFMKAGNSFYSVNPLTGIATFRVSLVDSTGRGGSGLRNALEFAQDGRLFSLDVDRQLAIIDLATNSFRSIGVGGPPLSAIAFLPDPPLPISQGVVNVNGQIAADLRGNPINVRLHFREGGTAPFADTQMSPSTTRSRRFLGSVPGQNITFRGVQYYVEADYGALGGVITIPEGAPGSLASFSGAGSTPAFATGSKNFILIGSPITPNDTNPEAVFDELGSYNTSKWRYGVFNPATGSYVEPPSAARTQSGQGFWLITKDPTTIVVDGRSADLSQNFRITLSEGFNQIANPFAFGVDVADLVIPTGVEPNFISWNGSSYVPGNAVLAPGVGYFVRNNGPGLKVLEIPPLGSGVSRALPQMPGLLADDDLGWSVEVAAATDVFSDGQNRFGQRDGATNEFDALDWSDAPAPPAGFATVSLVAEDGRALFADYRALSARGATWTVRFESDQVGDPYRVTFSPERELPAGWSLVAFEGKGAKETDLLASGRLTGVVGSESYAREWTVVAGGADYLNDVRGELRASVTAFAFSAPFPNPIGRRDVTSFDLEIPSRAHARVQVFDVQGRLVRTLLDGALDRGAHRVEWDGADRASRTVSAGVYFVKAEAGEFSTSRKVVRLQ